MPDQKMESIEATPSSEQLQPSSTKLRVTADEVRNALYMQAPGFVEKKNERIPTVRFSGREADRVIRLLQKFSTGLFSADFRGYLRDFWKRGEFDIEGTGLGITSGNVNEYIQILDKIDEFEKSTKIIEQTPVVFRTVAESEDFSVDAILEGAEEHGGKSPAYASDAGICVDNGYKVFEYLRGGGNVLFIYDASKLERLTADEREFSLKWAGQYGRKAIKGLTLRDAMLGAFVFE